MHDILGMRIVQQECIVVLELPFLFPLQCLMRRPGKIRNKVLKEKNRSGKAACELCGDEDFLEDHHIRGREIPEANHPSNIASICSRCHSKIHYGAIVVEGKIMTTDGVELIWHKKGEESLTGDDAKVHLIGG